MRSRRVLAALTAATATAALAFGGTAQASASSAAGEQAVRAEATNHSAAAYWHTSEFTSNPGACNAARALYAANGYPVLPTSDGCYRNDLGYYFRWWG